MNSMTPDRNIIARASALGWKSKHLGDEADADAALDWFCRELESMSGWWDAALKQRDAAQDREKLLRESLRVANDLLTGLDCVTVDLVPEAEPVGAGPR